MKISQKQAQLLAREIHKKLQKSNVLEVSDHIKNKIDRFYEKREVLKEATKVADKELDNHEKSIVQISAKLKGFSPYQGAKEAIKRIEERQIPSVSEIEDKIILKAMFATEQELEDFVDNIVKEYTKKKVSVS